jgi:signal transduction histidine kinase
MKRHGIERQTLLVALIPILVMAVLLENFFIYMRFADLDSALLERAQLMVRQLASSSEYAVFSGNTALLKQNVDAALAQRDVSKVVVLDAAAMPLMGDESGGRGQYETLLAQANKLAPLYQDGDVLLMYEPIVATQIKLDELEREVETGPSTAKPLGAVIIEFSKHRLRAQKNEILLFNLLATLLILMLTLVVALRVARRITAPILGMSRAIHCIGEGALDTRISPQPRVHELDELAVGINRMAQQLQQDRNTLQYRIAGATSELRQKKEEAENANHDKSRFLAAASHDLRQPMHALGLFVGELHGKVNTTEQARIVQQIEESIAAMSTLLNSLLDISKLDAGVVHPQVRAFPVDQLLKRMAQEYATVAEDKGIILRVKCPRIEVMSDPVLLERILFNLLNNALRYTPQHGCVFMACRKRGKRLRIEVRDNGIGIPDADQKNIFREFFQLDNAARERDKGLGLGLAIVERLAKLLGHPLSLRSAPGRGSVFAVEVPLHDNPDGGESPLQQENLPAPYHQDAVEPKAASLDGARVLLVDDDALVRASTKGMLASWGCEAIAAASLQEVRDQLAGQDFDLLICDYRLPDGAGLDVIRLLEDACHKRIPAILVSGDTSPEILRQVAASGYHLLHKPVRPAKLRSLLLYLVGGGNNKQGS